MTVEFPHEPSVAATPARPRFRLLTVLPWAAPIALTVVALFLPVTTAHFGSDGGVGGFSGSLRVDAYAFGRVRVTGAAGGYTGGAAYGWVWVAMVVGFAVAAVLVAVRPTTPWPGAIGVLAGGVGLGGVATLRLGAASVQSERATGLGLGTGSWIAAAAAVVGLVLGAVSVWRSTRAQVSSASANAGG